MPLGRVYVPPIGTRGQFYGGYSPNPVLNGQTVPPKWSSTKKHITDTNDVKNNCTNGYREIEIKLHNGNASEETEEEDEETTSLCHDNSVEATQVANGNSVYTQNLLNNNSEGRVIKIHIEKEDDQAIPEKINGHLDHGSEPDGDGDDEIDSPVPSRLQEMQSHNASRAKLEVKDVTLKATLFPSYPPSAKGLKNLGNTCYMNSIIQCLVHTRRLLEFCQSYNKNGPIQVGANSKNNDKIMRSFARLAQEMWKTGSPSGANHGVAEPSSFRREIAVFAPKFHGFEQHDSQEFLLYALDGLHTELNRVKKKHISHNNGSNCDDETENTTGDMVNGNHEANGDDEDDEEPDETSKSITYDDIEAEGINAEEKGRRCWIFYLNRDNSIITDLFLGQFRSTLRCSECRHESVTFEPFWVVSVPLSRDTDDIKSCLELFVKEETLDGDEKPTCEKCKAHRKCTKWYAFERWPEILVIQFKRFAPAGSYRAKLTNIVKVPLRHLDLSSFCSANVGGLSDDCLDSSRVIYDCYGISNHSGTLHGGHYTAYCRHPYKEVDNWHLYNDRCVSGTSPDHVITAEAYLIFFQKRYISTEHEE